MKNFPFRLLVLCIFLPPVLYILSVQGIESYLQRYETDKIRSILVKDLEALLEGQYSLQDEVRRNLNYYLKRNWLSKVGVELDILVKTKDGRIIYPGSSFGGIDSETTKKRFDYIETAAENYDVLNKGLDLSLSIKVRYTGLLSISLLALYIFASLGVLHHFIRKSLKAAQKIEVERERQITLLSQRLENANERLEQIKRREREYREKMTALKRERSELSKDVDELLEEMENLERGLKEEKDLREKTQKEVTELREELDLAKRQRKRGTKKEKMVENTRRRFKVLYKNLTFTDRALEGFLLLSDDFQLKAEEVISRLNQDGLKVQIRRKVFGKGGKKDILEAEFSYSGRLYFQKYPSGKVKIVAIGTKNSQAKDLGYLESIT